MMHENNGTKILSAETINSLAIAADRFTEQRNALKRCTQCILPESMPFISFDDHGVCNYCRDYKKMVIEPKDNLYSLLQSKKQPVGSDANCLFMLSGGRDSCYGLHYAVKELGLKPIAYTYDWGLGTDLASRNSKRMCEALGVEHVTITANIAQKKANVRKNIMAWLHKPELGMIPLLMAGDKQFYYYAEQVKRKHNLPVLIISENPLEKTAFKAGFCGINETGYHAFDISIMNKLKLLNYYVRRYAANPRYINSTLFDSAFAFAASYFMKHDLVHIFKYTRWEEETVNKLLIQEYGWETDPQSPSTWRIGDGTAAFYNYAYYQLAGFTENDTLRSNQIREGMITREFALKAVQEENKPRWHSLQWYAQIIGFDLEKAIRAILNAPKSY